MQASLSIGIVAPLVAPLREAQSYGNHVFIVDLARSLLQRGHAVVLYAAEGSVVPGVPLEMIAVDAAAHGAFQLLNDHVDGAADAMRQSFERLFERLRDGRHDVVSQHAFDAPAFSLDAGAPVLHTLHRPPMRREVVEAARACSAALASVSRYCAQQWHDAAGRDVVALPNGVPDCPVALEAAEPFALIAGRIAREKGVVAGLRAARRAGIAAVVVGDIDDQRYFDEEVTRELHNATLEPPMPRDRLRALMSRAAVTLMPIEWDEPFGLVAAEAQLAGCPVVGYARGALPEVVAEERGGFLVPPGCEDALIAAIQAARLLDRRTIREQARARLGIEPCVDRYERVLGELAARGR
jgi:glycosyltransferase involved in cell wall biosynthesis